MTSNLYINTESQVKTYFPKFLWGVDTSRYKAKKRLELSFGRA